MGVLALDIGASSARVIWGQQVHGEIEMVEVHRFYHEPVKLGNLMQWDIFQLFKGLEDGVKACKAKGLAIEKIGIDSFGVDYGLLGVDGELLRHPVCYRDPRHEQGYDNLLNQYDAVTLKKRTGMATVTYNTVCQLLSDPLIDQAETMLNIPDLLNYYLTGNRFSEYSMATTTQLFDYEKRDWNFELIEALKLPKTLFAPIIHTGSIYGYLKPELEKAWGLSSVAVVSVGSHDTASAIATIKDKKDTLFVATGTWVIVGVKDVTLSQNEGLLKSPLTHEGGVYPQVNLMCNHVGLWLLQNCKAYWADGGEDLNYGTLSKLGIASNNEAIIDVDAPDFFEPGDMPVKIHAYCVRHQLPIPETTSDYVRIIHRSIATKLADTIASIETIKGQTYKKIHLFGGGLKDQELCRWIEVMTGKTIIKGHEEATALGNIQMQLKA